MKQQEKNGMLEAAIKYLRMGWKVFPIQPNREPYGFKLKPLRKKKITEDMLREWWKQYPDAGVAVLTGEESGIVVLDVDAKSGRDISEFQIQPTAIARTQTGGWHVFYKHPGSYVKSTNGKLFEKGVDIKGDGGYVVLSPTIGEDGVYTWEVSPSDIEIDDMPEWLSDKVNEDVTSKGDATTARITQGVSEGTRNTDATSLIGRLLRYHPERFWDQDVLDLALAWNKTCTPPQSERDILATYNSVKKLELERRAAEKTGKKVIALAPALSMAELNALELPPVDWDVEHLIEHGTPNMLSAAFNNYKSWLLLLLGICVARGTPFLDYFKTRKQNVMIVNQEDHISIMKHRKDMLIGKGGDDIPLFFHVMKEIKLTDEHVASLLEEMREKNVTFAIFDPLRTFHNANENDSSEMQLVMDQLGKFTRAGVTVLFSHHHRKKPIMLGPKSNATGEESRGSSSINAAIHGHLTCEQKIIDGDKYLIVQQPKLKCAAKINPFQVSIEHDEQKDEIKFKYAGEYDDSRGGMRAQVTQKTFEVLDGVDEWMSVKDLMKSTGFGDSSIRDALKDLVGLGKVVSDNRRTLEKKGIQPTDRKGSHQEMFYKFKRDNDQPSFEQKALDDF